MNNSQIRYTINEAMTLQQAIQFRYKDEKAYRIGNPHAIGFSKKDVKESVRIYQTGGPSSTGIIQEDTKGENFRVFKLEDLDDVEVLTATFEVHKAFECCDSFIDWTKHPNKQLENCEC